MLKNKKMLAVGAGICMGAGVIIAGIGFLIGGRPGFYINASGIHSYHTELGANGKNTLEKTRVDAFSSISLNVSCGDVHIIPSDDYYIEYHFAAQSGTAGYSIENDMLTLDIGGKGEFLGFNFFSFGNLTGDNSNYVNLYVPEDKMLENIFINADMGDVTLGDIKTRSMDIEVDLGDLDIEKFEGSSLTADLGCGFMKAGFIDGQSVSIKNGMGDVSVERLSCSKTSDISMDMGSLSIEEASITQLDIQCDMGDVDLGLPGTIDDYKMDITVDLGDLSIPGYDSDTSKFISQNKEGAVLNINNQCGDVTVSFK